MARRGPHQLPPLGARSASWLAIVAATTFGSAGAEALRTQVRLAPAAQLALTRRPYRLVVQTYAARRDGEEDSTLPASSSKPLASTQRAVTAKELERGVDVDLVEIVGRGESPRGVVVAWIEPGHPNLEFDARAARPGPDSVYGLVTVADDPGHADGSLVVRLDRRVSDV